jgi:hypothetical protein
MRWLCCGGCRRCRCARGVHCHIYGDIALHNLHEELHHARPQYLMLSPDRVLMDVRAMRSIPTAVRI